MAHSLSGERSIAAASQANFVRSITTWFTGLQAARTRRLAMRRLLELDPARLDDLGISPADIATALASANGHTPGMVLGAARSRSARA